MAEMMKGLDGATATVTDILSYQLIHRYTSYETVESFFEALGVENEEQFKALDEAVIDREVRANTSFGSWKEMERRGLDLWIAQQLHNAKNE